MPETNIPPINITPSKKDENFDAISPKTSRPMLISTTQNKRALMGGMGWLFFLLFLVAAAGIAYFYLQLEAAADKVTNLEAQLSGSGQTAQNENVSLAEKVARHVQVPAGDPKITTVSDAESLKKSQPVYASVQNGDIVLTYSTVEVVYNSQTDRVLYIRSLNSSSTAVSGTENRAVQGILALDIRNGSGVVGAAARTAETFKGVSSYQVKNIANAAKNTYNTTILINITGKDVSGLEKQFSTTAMKELPVGEAASSADVVIIVGKQ